MTLKTRMVSIGIDRDWREVYAFASVPENMPRWASGLGKGFELLDGEWTGEGPEGPIKMRFTDTNPYGILDHHVLVAPGKELYIPARVIQNGAGAEVTFTVFQREGVTDEEFAADAKWVAKDLATLKQILESER
jgi:hypothetical protein